MFEIAPRMRYADVREIQAASGGTPLRALALGFAVSNPCQTIERDGRAEAMFGIVPPSVQQPVRVGAIWFLGTDEIKGFSRPFLRHSKEWVQRISEGYDVLHNVVDARNEAHIRWLRWLGFTFIARHEKLGHEQRPFYEFLRLTHV